MEASHLIGVISDTHGLLRPQAVEALQGVEMILHAGDVDRPEILEALRAIAPVAAVRGNVDRGEWANQLRQTQVVEVDDVTIYMIHNLEMLDLNPQAAQIDVVIYGHSHQPSTARSNGVLYLNPGSAGARRFDLPVSLALLRVQGKQVEAELVELQV